MRPLLYPFCEGNGRETRRNAEPVEGARSPRLGNVQAIRALSALAVVLVHAYAVESTYLLGAPWTRAFHVAGTFGVDVFFVVAGVIAVVTTAGAQGADAARAFLARRLTRVYPPYWVVTALLVVPYLVAPAALGAHRDAPPALAASFLALPQAGEPLLVVGWTLTYELIFYALYALALALRPAARPRLWAGWLAAVALIGALADPARPWARVLGAPFALEFVVGVAAGLVVLRRRIRFPALAAAAGAALLLLCGAVVARADVPFLAPSWPRSVALALPAALLIAGAIELERRGRVVAVPLRRAGDASYALYLWHVPVLGALGFALHRVRAQGPAAHAAVAVLGPVLAVAVSFAAYAVVERPLLRLTSRYVPSSAARSGASAAAQSS